MYKRILVAIDGSDTSNRAFQEAISLARNQQATLLIVNVMEGYSINSDTEFPSPEEVENAQETYLLGMLERARKSALDEGVAAESQLVKIESLGLRIADAIIQEAAKWSADLIVAGTHGRSGLSHLLVGSVAEGILRVSPVPILLIRSK
ncbi:MAG: universal stress protein [Sulfuricella sp.]